jgi:glutathione peroxidase
MKFIITLITIITMSSISAQTTSIYDLQINSLMGEKITLKKYKGKHILIVNVASKCGYTSQYKELQELHEKYKEKIVIIGVPCNQFGNQEPGSPSEIQSFCEKNYGVQFLITEKADVKGDKQHPLYSWLTSQELNGVSSSSVKWNFQKYMIDAEGNYLDVFYSSTKPNSSKITSFLE